MRREKPAFPFVDKEKVFIVCLCHFCFTVNRIEIYI